MLLFKYCFSNKNRLIPYLNQIRACYYNIKFELRKCSLYLFLTKLFPFFLYKTLQCEYSNVKYVLCLACSEAIPLLPLLRTAYFKLSELLLVGKGGGIVVIIQLKIRETI
jgi:hypothetical protein